MKFEKFCRKVEKFLPARAHRLQFHDRGDCFEFQDADPGYSGSYYHGVWTLRFNGAEGSHNSLKLADEAMNADLRRIYDEMGI